MVKALEGYQFDSVLGSLTIRADDHALLQPLFQAKLSGSGTNVTATLVKTVDAADTTPPVTPMKG